MASNDARYTIKCTPLLSYIRAKRNPNSLVKDESKKTYRQTKPLTLLLGPRPGISCGSVQSSCGEELVRYQLSIIFLVIYLAYGKLRSKFGQTTKQGETTNTWALPDQAAYLCDLPSEYLPRWLDLCWTARRERQSTVYILAAKGWHLASLVWEAVEWRWRELLVALNVMLVWFVSGANTIGSHVVKTWAKS